MNTIVIKILVSVFLVMEIKSCLMPETPPPTWKLDPRTWRTFREKQRRQMQRGLGCTTTVQTTQPPRSNFYVYRNRGFVCEITVKTTYNHTGSCIHLPRMNEPMCLCKYQRDGDPHTQLGRDPQNCNMVQENSRSHQHHRGRRIPINPFSVRHGSKACHLQEVVYRRHEGRCVRLNLDSRTNNRKTRTFVCESLDRVHLDPLNEMCTILNDD